MRDRIGELNSPEDQRRADDQDDDDAQGARLGAEPIMFAAENPRSVTGNISRGDRDDRGRCGVDMLGPLVPIPPAQAGTLRIGVPRGWGRLRRGG